MSYVLFNLITKRKVRSYSDPEGARRGMRCANRNAGWKRISRAASGTVEMEWCLPEANATGDVRVTQCGYGPYAIMPEREYVDTRQLIKTRLRRVPAEHVAPGHTEPEPIIQVEVPIKEQTLVIEEEKPKKEEPKKEPVRAVRPRKATQKKETAMADQPRRRGRPRKEERGDVRAAKAVMASTKRIYKNIRP